MKHRILILAIFFFPQFIYAQEPKMEITLRDIYEEVKDFRKEINKEFDLIQKDMLEIKQTFAKHDEKFKAVNQNFDAADPQFNEVNKRIYNHLHILLFATFIIIAFFAYLSFTKIFQIEKSLSNIETFLTCNIKPSKQKIREIISQRIEEFRILQNDTRKLREDLDKVLTALKKADILT